MKKYVLIVAAWLAVTMGFASAQSSYQIIDANSVKQTIKSFNCSSVICPGSVPMDQTGSAMGVTANPFYMAFGSGVTLPAFTSTPTFNCGTGCSSAAANTTAAISLTASSTGQAVALVGTASAGFQITSVGGGATIVGQISLDGGMTWTTTPIVNVTTSTPTVVTSTTTIGQYLFPFTNGATNARVFLTAYTSGTITGQINAVSQGSAAASYLTYAAAISPVAACSANPCVTTIGNMGALGIAQNVEQTPASNGAQVTLVTDLAHKLISMPYANNENLISGSLSSAMTGTTSTSLIPAPASGLRNYITACAFSNSHATVGTDMILQDGSGGTQIWLIPAAAVYGGAVITFPSPLKQPTLATALYVQNVTTGASTKASCSGYKGA